MENNITVVGLKEINQKITKMERSLEDISKSLERIAKIMDRQIAPPIKFVTSLEEAEDEDDLR